MCKAKLLLYFIFVNLTIGLFESALAKHSYQSSHVHLEPIIQDFLRFSNIDWKAVLPAVRGVLTEYSSLIKSLQERKTHSDFLPYIAEYEAFKGSPINPDIRIFFYDGSKLPLDHVYQINHVRGVCFSGLNFIFMNIFYWSSTVSHIV